MDISRERVSELPPTKCRGEVVDEFGGGDKQRVKAVLNGAISDRHRQMRFPSARFPAEDQTPSLGDEIRRQRGAQEGEADGGLMGEVEIINRLQKGKAGAADHAAHARLLPVRDFFGDQERKEIAITPLV